MSIYIPWRRKSTNSENFSEANSANGPICQKKVNNMDFFEKIKI